MKNEIALITYTNSVMSDVWPLYFGELNNFLGKKINSYVFSNVKVDIPENKNTQSIIYENKDPYWRQYIECLQSVEEDYIIYAQEDFFLYDHVNSEQIYEYKDVLKNSNYDYIRLIRAGYQTPLNQSKFKNLYEVDTATRDAFNMQITLWKKDKLINLYKDCKSIKWLESDDWNNSARKVKLKGLFYYDKEQQVGKYHYASKIYPYVCTGVNKGRWNTHLYPDYLFEMFKKYNINPDDRGMRLDYNRWTK